MTQHLVRRIGARKYQMWFSESRLTWTDRQLRVTTPSQFAAGWIEKNLGSDVRAAACDAVGHDIPVDIGIQEKSQGVNHSIPSENESADAAVDVRKRKKAARVQSSGAGDEDSPRLKLRNLGEFVVGPSNQLAYAAACRLAEDADPRAISPLFIHGECGLGKTHLIQGVCHRYSELGGRPQRVRYVTAEDFTNEYITAVRTSRLDAFRKRIRKLDLLAIDDVHFLSCKTKTQTEFLHTLDAIGLNGARLVLASDSHPHHIRQFSEALVSRFLSGMVARIEPPDRETRLALIRRLATGHGLKLSDAAAEAMADHYVGSIRELEGATTKLSAYTRLLGPGAANGHINNGHADVGLLLVQQVLKEHDSHPSEMVRMNNVIEVVSARTSVSKADLMGPGRHARVVLARSLVSYLGRELTTHSYPEIAQSLGRVNHSTIHTADQRLRRQLEHNESVNLGGSDGRVNLRELVDETRRSLMRGKRAGRESPLAVAV